jgi:WD repeat-containing protein 22
MKHGCFGGPGLTTDEYYSGGSDDFRAYIWKIPDIADLTDRRIEFNAEDWTAQGSSHDMGFAEGMWEPRYVPTDISRPLFRLNGHDSIVNTTLIHPSFLHILTSGVERHVILHGVAQSSICTSNMALTNTDIRNLPDGIPEDRERFLRAITRTHSTVRDGSEESDDEFETISLFDQILRQEGNADVFELRRWSPDPSDTDSSME